MCSIMYVVDPVVLKRKRQKFAGDPNAHLLRHLQAPMQDIASKFLTCHLFGWMGLYYIILSIVHFSNIYGLVMSTYTGKVDISPD